ncbi:MAG: hypothetical protein Kapaf2KO_22710 [Candidatus Kapaibacteriales bacterium]
MSGIIKQETYMPPTLEDLKRMTLGEMVRLEDNAVFRSILGKRLEGLRLPRFLLSECETDSFSRGIEFLLFKKVSEQLMKMPGRRCEEYPLTEIIDRGLADLSKRYPRLNGALDNFGIYLEKWVADGALAYSYDYHDGRLRRFLSRPGMEGVVLDSLIDLHGYKKLKKVEQGDPLTAKEPEGTYTAPLQEFNKSKLMEN